MQPESDTRFFKVLAIPLSVAMFPHIWVVEVIEAPGLSDLDLLVAFSNSERGE